MKYKTIVQTTDALKTIGYIVDLVPHLEVFGGVKDQNWGIQTAIKKSDMGHIWRGENKFGSHSPAL